MSFCQSPRQKTPMTPTFNSRHSRTTSGIGAEMTGRHNGCGRSRYGALDEPFRAFPSWFMRITCDRCGKDRMLNEAHTLSDKITIRAIIARLRWQGGWSCSPGSRAPAADRCGRSSCWTDEACITTAGRGSVLSCSRSASLSFTTYFFTAVCFAVPIHLQWLRRHRFRDSP
jgi:hypothetical protein